MRRKRLFEPPSLYPHSSTPVQLMSAVKLGVDWELLNSQPKTPQGRPMVVQTWILTKQILSFQDAPKKTCQVASDIQKFLLQCWSAINYLWIGMEPSLTFWVSWFSHTLHYNSRLTTSIGLQEQVLCFKFTESPGSLSM